MKYINFLCAVTIVCVPALSVAAGCDGMRHANQFGPFDYRTVSRETKVLVEGAHFTSEVEMLIRGHRGYLGGDIDYTLRAFPNSPRALLAMSRLGLKLKTERPEGAPFTIECYFVNALSTFPDDPMPYLIYSMYLKDRNRKNEALQQIETATKLKTENDSYEFAYNVGLVYFDLGVFDKSVTYAQQAYALGAPLPGLRNKLVAAGKWNDPSPQ